jgi:DNA-binding Lrp family transcriptional regulator
VVAGKNTWDTLISSFGRYVDNFVKNMLARTGGGSKDLCCFFLQSRFLLQHIVQFHIVPFGICAGSEKQGGQHEARNKPVQAATSHFTTMTVDGQNRDLVNFWRNVDIDGGDQLILYLGPVKRGGQVPYTLNHWSKGTVSKLVKFEDGLKGCTLQIIPSFYKAGEIEDHSSQGKDRDYVLGQLVANVEDPTQKERCKSLIASAMDYHVAGYWHCGQTYTKSSRFGLTSAQCIDAEYMTGALLQVNWAPVWKSGGLLEWFEKERFEKISGKIRDSEEITECYVTEYDHTYMTVLYAKNDLLQRLGK